jgi:hypothetical protein
MGKTAQGASQGRKEVASRRMRTNIPRTDWRSSLFIMAGWVCISSKIDSSPSLCIVSNNWRVCDGLKFLAIN